MNLRIHRLAVAEIDREIDYDESRQTGLGAELEDEIDASRRPDLLGQTQHRFRQVDVVWIGLQSQRSDMVAVNNP